jgi:hypothetical protein
MSCVDQFNTQEIWAPVMNFLSMDHRMQNSSFCQIFSGIEDFWCGQVVKFGL